jgi:hypothetical protein
MSPIACHTGNLLVEKDARIRGSTQPISIDIALTYAPVLKSYYFRDFFTRICDVSWRRKIYFVVCSC